MQRQHQKLDSRIDEAVDAAGELVLVGKERHEHAHGNIAAQDRPNAEKDQQDSVQPEEAGAYCVEDGIKFLHTKVGIDAVDKVVDPCAPAALLQIESLYAADAANAFHEMRVFLRGMHDRLLGDRAKRNVSGKADE